MRSVATTFVATFGALAACTASSDDVRPPADQLYFPTGAVVAPDESVMFVVNANSELRYDSGAISVFDLEHVDQVVAGWLASKQIPDGALCSQDPDHLETLTCDTSLFLGQTSTRGVRIGNFATDIAIQDRGGGAFRILVPTRGDPSVAWADWDGSQLSCRDDSQGFALCDDAHRLSFLGDTDLSIPNEPFGVFADSGGQFAMVTHLEDGAVTLIDSPNAGPAQIADVALGQFDGPPPLGGESTAVAGRTPRGETDIIYVASGTDDRIQTFTVGRPVNGAAPFLLSGNFFRVDGIGATSGNGSNSRSMVFSPTGDRLYLINRSPPAMLVLDTSFGPTGFPRNTPIGAADICRQASTVTVSDAGDGERVYATCFQDGQLYILDPVMLSTAVDIVTVGRGPYSVVASATRKKLYITNVLEDTIAVLDIAPGSPTRNRVVLRIGIPRGQS